jgi:FkbM family methyltransferase
MFKNISFAGRSLKIHGIKGDPYFDHLNAGDHTNDFLRKVAQTYVRPEATVFDVGANIGVTTAILGTAASRGRVFSFEPSPSVYPVLLDTIKANNLTHCTPYQLAVGAAPGQLGFFDNPTSASASHLVADTTTLGGTTHTVAVVTIDDFVAEHAVQKIDLIKIDVEGFELDVLAGAVKTLASEPSVFLEFNSFTLIAYGNQNPRTVMEKLLTMFPYVYRYEGGREHRIRLDDGTLLAFIHDNLVKRGCVDDLYCSFQAI